MTGKREKPLKSAGISVISGGSLAALGVLFLAMGLGFSVWQWREASSFLRARTWVGVPATLTEFRCERERSRQGYVNATLEYRYDFGGMSRSGSRLGLGGNASNTLLHIERCKKLWTCQKTGQPITAWINPENPQESVLFRELDSSFWPDLISGAAFVFAGMVTGFAGVRRMVAGVRRRRRLRKAADRPWRADERWAQGFRFEDARDKGKILIFVAIGLPLGCLNVAILWSSMVTDKSWIYSILAIAGMAVAAAMACATSYWLITSLKFGTVFLELDEMPAGPGRGVIGKIICDRRLDAIGSYTLTAKCVRQDCSPVDPSVDIICMITAEAREAPGTALAKTVIPFEIPIPKGLPCSTVPDQKITVNWSLCIEGSTPGIDFKAEFDLPVFHVKDESLIEKRPEGAAS